ncbi:hypothetical protein H4W80_009960 [Nonomuraea angiospora]|uniref:Transposase IS4 N-terminal domain-containing protein n=1 Tax=Nonomuraea angiospora TaxID=46172 RepID=A0ABR9MGR3_9ACTN|nr:hypothetical protein [Nonomuraea angiospora]
MTDPSAVCALTSLIPCQVLDPAIAMRGCGERRVRKLPAHVLVYPLIGLCLCPDDDYEIIEKLTGTPALASAREGTQRIPDASPGSDHQGVVQTARLPGTPAGAPQARNFRSGRLTCARPAL